MAWRAGGSLCPQWLAPRRRTSLMINRLINKDMKASRYIFPGDYMADPSAHVFNGKLYIYPSHDRESGIPENDNGDHFDMRDYHCPIAGCWLG